MAVWSAARSLAVAGSRFERERRTIDEVLIPRLERVIDGEQGGISSQVGWAGGGSFDVHG